MPKASNTIMPAILKTERLKLREGNRAYDDPGANRTWRSSRSLLQWFATLVDEIVFVCLLGLIVLIAIPYGTVDAWWEAVFECAIFAVTATWILGVLFRGRWQLDNISILVPLLIITSYAFVQTIGWPAWFAPGNGRLTAQHTLTIDRYQTYLTVRKTLALTSFLGLLLLHTATPKRLRWLVRVVIGLGLASALFGILRQLLQSPDSTTGFVLPYLFWGMGYGQFLSPNAFAYLGEMAFGLVAGMVLGGGIRRDLVLLYLTIAVVLWAAVVLSNSRGGIVALVCESIFLLFVSLTWYSARRLSRADGMRHEWLAFISASVFVRVLAVLFISGILVVGAFWMGGQELAGKLGGPPGTVNQVDFDRITREDVWHSTWELIKRNPWTGVGFGSYFLAIPEFQLGAGRIKVEEAHNDYLDLAASGGIVAVVLALWFIVMVIRRARSSLRSGDAYRRAACLGAAAGILGVGVHSLVDFGLQVTSIAVVFAALVVIVVADKRVESLSTKPKGESNLPRTTT